MSKFFLLVRTNVLVLLGTMRKNRTPGRYVLSGLLLAFAFVMITLSFGSQSFIQQMLLRESGIPELGITVALVTALSLSTLIGLMRAATMPRSNDADLLLSVPIPRTTVIASKIVTQYIFDAPFIIMIFGSSVIAYRFFGGDLSSFLRGLLLTFLLPLIPVTLSYFLGSAIAALSERFRGAKLVATGLLMLLLVGYMFINFSSSAMYRTFENLTREQGLSLIHAIAPLGWLTDFVTEGTLLPVVLTLAILLLPFYLAIQVYAVFFGRQGGAYRSKEKKVIFGVKSPRMALFDKEVKRYLSMPLYIFNTAFGPVLLVVFAGFITVLGPEKVFASMGMTSAEMNLMPQWVVPVLTSVVLAFICSMTSTTAASISLEGKNLWILRVSPVTTDDIFFGKCLLNVVLIVPIGIVSVIAIGLRIGQGFPEILFHSLALTVLGIMLSCVGLIANLLFPKLKWDSEAQVVKQGMSVVMNMLFALILTGLPFPLMVVLLPTVGIAGFYAAQTVIYGIFLLASMLFLKTAGKKMFEALS